MTDLSADQIVPMMAGRLKGGAYTLAIKLEVPIRGQANFLAGDALAAPPQQDTLDPTTGAVVREDARRYTDTRTSFRPSRRFGAIRFAGSHS